MSSPDTKKRKWAPRTNGLLPSRLELEQFHCTHATASSRAGEFSRRRMQLSSGDVPSPGATLILVHCSMETDGCVAWLSQQDCILKLCSVFRAGDVPNKQITDREPQEHSYHCWLQRSRFGRQQQDQRTLLCRTEQVTSSVEATADAKFISVIFNIVLAWF